MGAEGGGGALGGIFEKFYGRIGAEYPYIEERMEKARRAANKLEEEGPENAKRLLGLLQKAEEHMHILGKSKGSSDKSQEARDNEAWETCRIELATVETCLGLRPSIVAIKEAVQRIEKENPELAKEILAVLQETEEVEPSHA